jgi:hypothetical protein
MRADARLVLRGLAAAGALINGTLYVVQDGKYWTLMPDQIGDTELEALAPSGEIGGTLPSDLLMVPAPEAVQPPAPAPAPAAPAPPAPAPPPPAAPAPPPPPAGPPQVTIGNPTEGSNVNAGGGRSYTITGSATDPVGGAGAIDSVEVWIFGERNANGATNLGPATILSDGSWSLTFLPTRFVSTHTNIYVYVHSKATGLESVASRGFNIVG